MTDTSFAEKLAGTRIETGAGPHVLLPAFPRHAGFVNLLLRNTMEAYVRAAWQEEADIEAYFRRNAFDGRAADTLILHALSRDSDLEPAGVITALYASAEGGERAVDLSEIHILPSLQGKGLGRALITAVQEMAAPLPVTLIVLDTNPAIGLYEKLGFKVVRKGEGDTAHRWHMMWRP